VTKLLFGCTGFYASPYFRRDCVVRENDSKSRNGTPFPAMTCARSGLAPESDLSGLIKCCRAMTVGWPPIARKTVQTLVGVAGVNLTRDCKCGFALPDLKQAVNSKQEDLQHECSESWYKVLSILLNYVVGKNEERSWEIRNLCVITC
jgi:hypothetical protein